MGDFRVLGAAGRRGVRGEGRQQNGSGMVSTQPLPAVPGEGIQLDLA